MFTLSHRTSDAGNVRLYSFFCSPPPSMWAWKCPCSGWQKKLPGLIDAPGTFQPRAWGHISPHTGRDLAQRRSAEMPLMGSDRYGWDNTGYECSQPGLLLVLWISSEVSFTSILLKTLEKFEAGVARFLNHPTHFFLFVYFRNYSDFQRGQEIKRHHILI